MKKIIETKAAMVSEHKRLVKELRKAAKRTGDKALASEAVKQQKELKGYERA